MVLTPKLVLILVAYHASLHEVRRIKSCLDILSADVSYGVVVNDYQNNDPADLLEDGARFFIKLDENCGYGRAVNKGYAKVPPETEFIGALNVDLAWEPNLFESALSYLVNHKDIVLAVPTILDFHGQPQSLCKRDPTLLALLSRRFISDRIKPRWLRHYDRHYVMQDIMSDNRDVIEVPYLSGCCMLIRARAFRQIGGFDERYFLYLEDADITRTLRQYGRCVHIPWLSIRHAWGRGNHRNLYLTLVNLHSAWLYFMKWGWAIW